MKYIIAIALLAATASAQVVNVTTGEERGEFPRVIYINGLPASGASEAQYNAAGWHYIGTREQPSEGNRATVTEWQVSEGLANLVILEQEAIPRREPPSALIDLAGVYRDTLRAIFGQGAETNRAVTQAVVESTVLQMFKNAETQGQALLAERVLDRGFSAITQFMGTNESWTFFEVYADLLEVD